MDKIADTLLALRAKGVRVWSDGTGLRYRAPKGALTTEDIESLKKMSGAITAFLKNVPPPSNTVRAIAPRLGSDEVPLTFAQRFLWTKLELCSRDRIQIPTALRLSGGVNIGALRAAFSALVSRHEALRTRINVLNGQPRQEILAAGEFDVEVIDKATVLAAEREDETRQFLKLLNRRVSVTAPLFAVKLLRFGEDYCVVVVLWDHLAYDGASIPILWRELWTLYGQAISQVPLALPKVSIQYGDYAVWERTTQDAWCEQHGAYWKSRLSGGKRLRLFPPSKQPTGLRPNWDSAPIHFNRQVCEKLQSLSRCEGTTPTMSYLAIYVALLSRWSEETDLVIPFVTAGRVQQELQNTIGYFGSLLFLRFQVRGRDTLHDLIRRVTSEYSAAYEHNDGGRIAVATPAPKFLRNPFFNWFPKEINVDPASLALRGIPKDARRSLDILAVTHEYEPDDYEWDEEPRAVLLESDVEVGGFLTYRSDRVYASDAERLCKSFCEFAEALSENPTRPIEALRCKK